MDKPKKISNEEWLNIALKYYSKEDRQLLDIAKRLFPEKFENFPECVIENFANSLNKKNPAEAIKILNDFLYIYKKQVLNAEIGGSQPDNWQKIIVKILNNELNHQRQRLPEQPQKSAKKPKEILTYQWTKERVKQLPVLHRRLIDSGLIDSQTDLQTFTDCFTGQPVPDRPVIKWLRSKGGIVLLAYFINCLNDLGFIKYEKYLYSIAEKCFADVTRTDLSQAKYQYLENKKTDSKPIDHILIDEVLNNL